MEESIRRPSLSESEVGQLLDLVGSPGLPSRACIYFTDPFHSNSQTPEDERLLRRHAKVCSCCRLFLSYYYDSSDEASGSNM